MPLNRISKITNIQKPERAFKGSFLCFKNRLLEHPIMDFLIILAAPEPVT